MHPSSARHYSDLLPPTNISPFFKFSQHFRARLPADWQGAHFPEPFPPFPPFPPGWLPTCGGQRLQTPLPGCTSPQQPRSKGWYPGLPTLHPPKSRLLYFPCNSHQEGWDGRSGLQGGTLSPTPASQDALSLCNGYPRSQPRHAACSWWFRLRFLTPKK